MYMQSNSAKRRTQKIYKSVMKSKQRNKEALYNRQILSSMTQDKMIDFFFKKFNLTPSKVKYINRKFVLKIIDLYNKVLSNLQGSYRNYNYSINEKNAMVTQAIGRNKEYQKELDTIIEEFKALSQRVNPRQSVRLHNFGVPRGTRIGKLGRSTSRVMSSLS